jgi:hypothetical protein
VDVKKLLEWGESEVRKTLDATGTTIAYVDDWRARIVPLQPITERITVLKSKLQLAMTGAFERHRDTISGTTLHSLFCFVLVFSLAARCPVCINNSKRISGQ